MIKRKLLIFIFSIISILSISATTMTFKSTGFSYRERNYYSWSNWRSESSNVTIMMMDNILIIYSPTVQTYDLYNLQDPYQDVDGDWILKSNFIDQDGDIGEFNLISPLNRELLIGLSKSCEDIKVLINESNKELILIFNDNTLSLIFI